MTRNRVMERMIMIIRMDQMERNLIVMMVTRARMEDIHTEAAEEGTGIVTVLVEGMATLTDR